MPNRINLTLTDAQITALNTSLTQLQAILEPFAVELTPRERSSMPKISIDNKVFVEQAINVAMQPGSADLLPPFLSPTVLQNDLTLYEQMLELEQRMQAVMKMIEETRMLAGSEAYTSALTVKRIVDAATVAGMPGAQALSNILRERFVGQGAATEEEAEPNGGGNPA